jgi:hypothetical protein
MRTCQIVFDVRSIIYNDDFDQINFVKSLLSNNAFDSNWVWQRYRLRLNEIEKSSFIWKFFCDFLKKQVSSIKLKITTIDQKIKLLHQRNNQTIVQFIAYFEVLKKQWLELILNNLRANNLFFALHEYLRKKIVRKNVNVSNRKIVKKTTRQMKIVETKSFQKQQTKQESKFMLSRY